MKAIRIILFVLYILISLFWIRSFIGIWFVFEWEYAILDWLLKDRSYDNNQDKDWNY